jgi:hypothetical protein
MWKIKDLRGNLPHHEIDGKWVPAKLENFKNKYLSIFKRFKRAWMVFTGKADCFTWPEDDTRTQAKEGE